METVLSTLSMSSVSHVVTTVSREQVIRQGVVLFSLTGSRLFTCTTMSQPRQLASGSKIEGRSRTSVSINTCQIINIVIYLIQTA